MIFPTYVVRTNPIPKIYKIDRHNFINNVAKEAVRFWYGNCSL